MSYSTRGTIVRRSGEPCDRHPECERHLGHRGACRGRAKGDPVRGVSRAWLLEARRKAATKAPSLPPTEDPAVLDAIAEMDHVDAARVALRRAHLPVPDALTLPPTPPRPESLVLADRLAQKYAQKQARRERERERARQARRERQAREQERAKQARERMEQTCSEFADWIARIRGAGFTVE